MVCVGDYETELFIERDDEEDSVTLQVGMMARDGIILAGDVWTIANVGGVMAAEARRLPVWTADATSKITITEDGSMAISRAHDMRQAQLVSDAIATELLRQYWENPEKRIEQIAEAALIPEPEGRGVHCLVALKSPTFSLFKVVCAKEQATKKMRCACTRASGQVFAGDCHNPATFWATRYLLVNPEHDPTVDELLPLAVQIVVDASQINSGSIRGLEIIVGDGDGFRRLPVEQCKAWAAEAAQRARAVEKMVMKPLPFNKP